MDFLKLLCLSDRIQASKREKEKMLKLKANYLSNVFFNSPSSFILWSYSTCEIYPPSVKLMEISTSPHFVNRLDTNDPNDSTAAPV